MKKVVRCTPAPGAVGVLLQDGGDSIHGIGLQNWYPWICALIFKLLASKALRGEEGHLTPGRQKPTWFSDPSGKAFETMRVLIARLDVAALFRAGRRPAVKGWAACILAKTSKTRTPELLLQRPGPMGQGYARQAAIARRRSTQRSAAGILSNGGKNELC